MTTRDVGQWFHVAYPDDLVPGEVTALRYFGRDLVCWRDEAGGFHVQDAYCPHLGVHIGLGGTVEGNEVVCPFHGWRYDATGKCADQDARLRTYPTVVRNGLVLAWYHQHDEPPSWQVPVVTEVDDPGWSGFHIASYVIHAAPDGDAFMVVRSSDAINVVTATPIDDGRTQLRFNVLVRNLDDEETTAAARAYRVQAAARTGTFA
jgi:phenylpropionate dioxygenase-like ring-hydroxylating dioxygenase large terminal subunit